MTWEKKSAQMNLTFFVDGGTLSFEGAAGEGYFEGTLTYPRYGNDPPIVSGVLTLGYEVPTKL